MRPVAERGSRSRLARAPGDFFLFRNVNDLRGKPCGPVRTVAERLFLGKAAGTPGIGLGFSVKDVGVEFGHGFFGYRGWKIGEG